MTTPDSESIGNPFPKHHRLLTKKQYQRVFDAPKKGGARGLTVLARKNQLDHPRLGLIVAKKKIRLAVDRNRSKRLVREVFRNIANRLDSTDIVVIVQAPAKHMTFSEVEQSFNLALTRLTKAQ